MRFIEHGPDIPPRLLRDHQDGKVVFFCGAGISKDAGFPLFDELADEVFLQLSPIKSSEQMQAFKNKSFDLALGLLEREYPKPHALNSAVWDVFARRTKENPDLSVHESLLRLSQHISVDDPRWKIRLVTTNWDRLFELAKKQVGIEFPRFVPTALPVPKPSEWNGLVYLHGLLPKDRDSAETANLVMTSSDFGFAYLREGWAARFVTELFDNFSICFVGYSLNDPLLRYMTDSLQSARAAGDVPESYIFSFASSEPGCEERVESEWLSKGVRPILYRSENNDHSLLRDTLRKWSEQYESGISGRLGTIAEIDNTSPRSQDEVEATCLAISRSSFVVKAFAEKQDPPGSRWLSAFECDEDFGMSNELDSLFQNEQEVSSVAFQFGRWISRLQTSPETFLWILSKPRQLNWRFRLQLQDALSTLATPTASNLWRLYLAGAFNLDIDSLFDDKDQWKVSGTEEHQVALVCEIEQAFAPRLRCTMRASHPLSETSPSWNDIQESLEVVLFSQPDRSAVFNDSTHELFLPALVSEHFVDIYQDLLKRALMLIRFAKGSKWENENVLWEIPSISPHEQNKQCRSWGILLYLLRDSWRQLFQTQRNTALSLVRHWADDNCVLFRRLALYAASLDNSIPPDEWCNWLSKDVEGLLWNSCCRHEVGILLSQANRLSREQYELLENRIMTDSTRAKNVPSGVDRAVRLARLRQSGVSMSSAAKTWLDSFETDCCPVDKGYIERHEIPQFFSIADSSPSKRESRSVDVFEAQNPEKPKRTGWRAMLDGETYSPATIWRERADFLAMTRPSCFAKLGSDQERYASILARYALSQVKGNPTEDLRQALSLLPLEKGWSTILSELENELEQSGEANEKKWDEVVGPFLVHFWHFRGTPTILIPTVPGIGKRTDDKHFRSSSMARLENQIRQIVAQQLFRLCILVPSRFKQTYDIVKYQLCPRANIEFEWMGQSGVCATFPETVLDFLWRSLPQGGLSGLEDKWKRTLRQVIAAKPALANAGRFHQLEDTLGPIISNKSAAT